VTIVVSVLVAVRRGDVGADEQRQELSVVEALVAGLDDGNVTRRR